ncbi:MAG: hypothetical protein ABH869_03920 [Candidatus Omnitrophota bacterium]
MEKDPIVTNIFKNIEEADRLGRENQSVKLAAVISGNEIDRENCKKRLSETASYIFNKDASTLILSLVEKIGRKTKEGNFLGTLLAYKYIKQEAEKAGIEYRDNVTLLGMLFGRGERMSPFTQTEGDRKGDIVVTPGMVLFENNRIAFSALEEALHHFVPVAKYLEKRGFKGILNKWGDETEIASIDLTGDPVGNKKKSLIDCDIIKFISDVDPENISDVEAREKDWVIFDKDHNMLAQISRNRDGVNALSKDIEKCRIDLGIDAVNVGISLGPVATSYKVIEIAEQVFADEIKKEGVYLDYDPHFMMCLAMENNKDKWLRIVKTDRPLQRLLKAIPDFFDKVQMLKNVFTKQYGRKFNLKVVDLGRNLYWADIGLHSAMRKKYMSFNYKDLDGTIARKMARIPEGRDKNGNIIIGSCISESICVTDSVIINAVITGNGNIEKSVILDSEFEDVEMKEAFAVKSVRYGKTILNKNSGIYNSLGMEDLDLEESMRHTSILARDKKIDMMVSENTDLRDTENTYNIPICGNPISFNEAYEMMFGVSMDELKKRRSIVLGNMDRIKQKSKRFKPLKFGTSGLRALVSEMTDMECYINTNGFIKFLEEKGEMSTGEKSIALGGDLRSSTPRIMAVVGLAIRDMGYKVDFCGFLPSSALASYAIKKEVPSIMVTGSHIPDDRNGIKFTKKSGEILKTDESDILKNVKNARDEEYAKADDESLFNESGMLKDPKEKVFPEQDDEAVRDYVNRYLEVFPGDALGGMKIVFYQHSAVARDIMKEIFEKLGAEIIPVGRSDKFVPVDTEKVSEDTRQLLRAMAEKYSPFAVISADGDSDRPLLADENGDFLSGDKLGALVSMYLKPDFAAVPISANDAVIKALKAMKVNVKQTQIGSPYIIAAMNRELEMDPGIKAVGWESNGGFLLGQDWQINGKILKALAARDAVLPLLAVLLLAKKENMSLSKLISTKLPARYLRADVVDNKTSGCEKYTADMGKALIKMFSPENDDIIQVDFEAKGGRIYYNNENEDNVKDLEDCFIGIRETLARYFSKDKGFDDITSVNFIDGIRIIFRSGDVVHIRPSGNAPEFRMYVTSDSNERVEEIIKMRGKIVAEMVKNMQ